MAKLNFWKTLKLNTAASINLIFHYQEQQKEQEAITEAPIKSTSTCASSDKPREQQKVKITKPATTMAEKEKKKSFPLKYTVAATQTTTFCARESCLLQNTTLARVHYNFLLHSMS